MPLYGVLVNSKKPLSLAVGTTSNAMRGKPVLRKVVNALQGALSGTRQAPEGWNVINSETSTDALARAGGFSILASGNGTESVVIDGTTVSITWATSDANSASLLATAINADATVSKLVSAHRRVAKVTCATVVAGNSITVGGITLTAAQKNARGTITLVSSVAGNTVTVNGTVFTGSNTPSGDQYDTSGTDANAATSLAAAINASTDAGVAGIITATAAANVVTVRAVSQGTAGNAYTLAKSGAPITLSGATLSGGSAQDFEQFDYGDTDTQTGLALANCINNCPAINNRWFSANTAGVVYLALTKDEAARSSETLTKIGAPITINNQVTQGAIVAIVAHQPGHIGNAISFTVSGTNHSKVTLGTNKLGGGLGLTALSSIIPSSYL